MLNSEAIFFFLRALLWFVQPFCWSFLQGMDGLMSFSGHCKWWDLKLKGREQETQLRSDTGSSHRVIPERSVLFLAFENDTVHGCGNFNHLFLIF